MNPQPYQFPVQSLQNKYSLDDSGLWSIFDDLARMPETERLRVLRQNFEAGLDVRDQADLIDIRDRLDRALYALTYYEVGAQIGLIPEKEMVFSNLRKFWRLFRHSDALLRYTNANLFFGARFFAGRLRPPRWIAGPKRDRPMVRRRNERPYALMSPPTLVSSDQPKSDFFQLLTLDPCAKENSGMQFLDGYTCAAKNPQRRDTARDEPEKFELWLRGLKPDADPEQKARFEKLSLGIIEWATSRSDFYALLPKPGDTDTSKESQLRPSGGWRVDSPIAARFALVEVYWIASVLSADVEANASVTYRDTSWLHLLRIHASLQGKPELEKDLLKAEEVLRSVFGFAMDLVQNAVEVTSETERKAFEPELFVELPKRNAGWRETFDEELKEITKQREIRRFGSAGPKSKNYTRFVPSVQSAAKYWSEKLKTGRCPANLIGLALSGGGVRSATFSLGVLQGLQELDLLRSVDYLSTVSGGGFIGAWLIANVCRAKHWLGRLTNWDESVDYLRRYSSYLSPLTGILSTDSWTLWGTWARNAFLIQVTGLAWLLSLLLFALLSKFLFNSAAIAFTPPGLITWPGYIALIMLGMIGLTLAYNFIDALGLKDKQSFVGKLRKKVPWLPNGFYNLLRARSGWASGYVRWLAVVPSWIGSFFMAALIWGDATGQNRWRDLFNPINTYSGLLLHAWRAWLVLLITSTVTFFLISLLTLSRLKRSCRPWLSAAIAALCVTVFYLQLCGIAKLYIAWRDPLDHYLWSAAVLGPSLMMTAFTITVVLLIGLSGRFTDDAIREWWTRFGALLTMFAALYLAIAAAAVFGPMVILSLLNRSTHGVIKWGAVASSILSIGGGIFAGKSGQTDGQATRAKSLALELLARFGGFVFIVTSVLCASTLLFFVLTQIDADFSLSSCSWNFSGCYLDSLNLIKLPTIFWATVLVLACGFVFSFFFDINIFGLSQFYTNRLVRCYLGATRWAPGQRRPQAFTAFDGDDDLLLNSLAKDFRGPFPILNCSLNLGGSSDLTVHTRHSASFFLTPLRCGSDRRKLGFARTGKNANGFAGGVTLGQAMGVSGAAASPNMGYNTSPLVAFLLTMFNVRLGWWFPNPGQKLWKRKGLQFSLYYLFRELVGTADENRGYVNITDGGHFENLGIYELVRRRCRLIIAVDGECDEHFAFGSLGNVVRICETDFGAKIDIDISSIRRGENGLSRAHCAVGKILYSNGTMGYLIYLKSSVTGDEDVGVAQYRSTHPTFPHETTLNQFFTEDQFEAYRRLGHHAVLRSFRGTRVGENPVEAADRMANLLVPEGCESAAFLQHAKALDGMWERFRQSAQLQPFFNELQGIRQRPAGSRIFTDERIAASELIQLMENVFLDLRLEDFWEHPDNRGWAMLFTNWARSQCLRSVWNDTRSTYGIRFEYFCAARLGLERDDRPVRL